MVQLAASLMSSPPPSMKCTVGYGSAPEYAKWTKYCVAASSSAPAGAANVLTLFAVKAVGLVKVYSIVSVGGFRTVRAGCADGDDELGGLARHGGHLQPDAFQVVSAQVGAGAESLGPGQAADRARSGRDGLSGVADQNGLLAGDGEGVGPGRGRVLGRHLDLDDVLAPLQADLLAVRVCVGVGDARVAAVQVLDSWPRPGSGWGPL